MAQRAPLPLYEVRRHGDDVHTQRVQDPVCGMELDADQAQYRLLWRGNELFFCSEACLQHFAAQPDRYPHSR